MFRADTCAATRNAAWGHVRMQRPTSTTGEAVFRDGEYTGALARVRATIGETLQLANDDRASSAARLFKRSRIIDGEENGECPNECLGCEQDRTQRPSLSCGRARASSSPKC